MPEKSGYITGETWEQKMETFEGFVLPAIMREIGKMQVELHRLRRFNNALRYTINLHAREETPSQSTAEPPFSHK